MISPFPDLPSEIRFLDFLDWTLTTTRAGLRSPTRTSSDKASASVMVALKSPVRLCFGKCVMIRVNAFWNPKSRSLRNRDKDEWDESNKLSMNPTYLPHPGQAPPSPSRSRPSSLSLLEIPPLGLACLSQYRHQCLGSAGCLEPEMSHRRRRGVVVGDVVFVRLQAVTRLGAADSVARRGRERIRNVSELLAL